ncbi:MAG: Fe-S cluster assembly protein SufD [Zetaproteobacteria bacterium CG_4_9_14_3_um_filter_49_83]|nr:MAG: Fe-S cluster assembly protein SufD [Zetaproteobacteria bacterium CG1_02_49_23]PIQ33396.1 MAG: Fe-S cluster assembly protein SufD [Zetaproteobacteria bacterium CG17_big_fil_post_rev_8_21_14_2_50_50_13]PIV31615.1 MAG: Fe-S cluster assembly protein SufD [Zetaproteobacteria bacterium CG02_land_8_20_14_3_00_50_9]PIY55759.1 MAG: Fe-S cluster assembly protein SufD [Zetaproteobacteria bacterium CG_4_10_14_0_8_um_filter_49_80]PJA35079.1 MAG: Fe-S cluster assembly protein SufD [Zetaproteobacteria
MPEAYSIEQLRAQAFSLFERLGLPGRKLEDWKYTDVSRLASTLGETWWQATSEQPAFSAEGSIEDLDAYRMVFVSGVFVPAQSKLPDGVDVLPLADLLKRAQSDDSKALFKLDTDAPLMNGFVAVAVALAQDGLCACIADGVILDKPLYMIHVGHGRSHVLSGVMLGTGAEATLIEHFIGSTDEVAGLSNTVTYARLAANASLTHYRLQQEHAQQYHMGRVEVKQSRDSRYVLHAVELGSSLSRLDVLVKLAEENASCELNGLFVASGRQHIDHHTRVDHIAPRCVSRENYRTLLDGRSHGVFNGKVVVHKGAVKTDSSQSNANLLLSKKSEIDTKPELEIYNDDVKCAHGATIGQLDQAQLYYLTSRGVPEAIAKELLLVAFADSVLVGMKDKTVRRFIERAAFAKLPHTSGIEGLTHER